MPTPPTIAAYRARAEELVPLLRERAQKTETLRRIPDETIAELHQAGLFRIHQPVRVRGGELPFRAIVELVAVIARGCASTAWVLANLVSHHWMLGYFDPKAQDEIWSADPNALIGSAVIFNCGKAKRVPGGYRVSGRWPFSSGVHPSSWLIMGATVEGEADSARMFLVRQSDIRILDTWHVMGLAGTGSEDVTMEDVFVPE
ncbi:MAG TPA: acyl-CoA dehydrogenase family protein, partial [Stellaceae bacterium]|nr:acyl-CoA dehydrogenase family protein [Stellaceae bacterium]